MKKVIFKDKLEIENEIIPIAEDSSYDIQDAKDEIWFLRQEDDLFDRGDWIRKLKTANWKMIKDISIDNLAKNRSLWLGARLFEALINLDGVSGCNYGIKIINKIMSKDFSPKNEEERDIIKEWLQKKAWLVIKSQEKFDKDQISECLRSLNQSTIKFADLKDFLYSTSKAKNKSQ